MRKKETQKMQQIQFTRQILVGDIRLAIFFVGIILSILTPYFLMRTDIKLIQADISTIQQNHEEHMRSALDEIAAVKSEIKDQNKRMEEIMILLNSHIAATK